ncbi:uncharacterized protein KY384_002767 [Bacidia gigantensis]|uniref:uncharacterized protein n=1 Tax=Bacidia gigantensis TaxID=2732470 RepID=UPI001D04A6F6|nr:uncharacterized protein KY384_002767 [Bacidia gigantensis]KAG8532889.1 hypothetical protein KY384_002767 [Bacidia gigantensis]
MKLRSGDDYGQTVAQRKQAKYVVPIAGNEVDGEQLADDWCREVHNATTLLLRLPPEIRVLIYKAFFGRRMLHIDREHKKGHSDLACVHNQTGPVRQLFCFSHFRHPRETYAEFTKAENNRHHNEHTVTRVAHAHDKCHENLRLPKSKRVSDEKLSCALLQTCRQIYLEARLIPYNAHVFSFRSCHVLNTLLDPEIDAKAGLKPFYLEQIRAIHLDIPIHHPYDATRWVTSLNLLPTKLPKLRDLYIDIHEIYCACWIGSDEGVEGAYMKEITAFTAAAAELRKCPLLQNVYVVIDDVDFMKPALGFNWFDYDDDENDDARDFRSTLQQKREAAEFLRRKILGLEQCTVDETESTARKAIGTFRVVGAA